MKWLTLIIEIFKQLFIVKKKIDKTKTRVDIDEAIRTNDTKKLNDIINSAIY